MALKTKYSPLQHLSIENLYTAFLGLGPREKVIALAAVGVLVLFFLFLPFSLASGKLRSMQRKVTQIEEGTREVLGKISDFRKSQAEIREIERRFGSVGTISGRVEGAARETGLKVDQLKERPPQDTDFFEIHSVEARLSGASLQQAIDFIYKIENDPSGVMRFRRIQMKPKYANRQLLDLSCEIATFQPKKEG